MDVHPALTGDSFAEAVVDYRHLLTRGYSSNGALRLVGDRYRLTGEQRVVLYRGICSEKTAARRRKQLVPLSAVVAQRQPLLVDGYNQIVTIMNYVLGRPVFISDDGIVRDAGSAHRRTGHSVRFSAAVRALCEFIADRRLSADIYLDEPVTASRDHAQLLRQEARAAGASVQCTVVRSADAAIVSAAEEPFASSDSGILDKHSGGVLDLARAVIEERFHADLVDLAVQYPRRTSSSYRS